MTLDELKQILKENGLELKQRLDDDYDYGEEYHVLFKDNRPFIELDFDDGFAIFHHEQHVVFSATLEEIQKIKFTWNTTKVRLTILTKNDIVFSKFFKVKHFRNDLPSVARKIPEEMTLEKLLTFFPATHFTLTPYSASCDGKLVMQFYSDTNTVSFFENGDHKGTYNLKRINYVNRVDDYIFVNVKKEEPLKVRFKNHMNIERFKALIDKEPQLQLYPFNKAYALMCGDKYLAIVDENIIIPLSYPDFYPVYDNKKGTLYLNKLDDILVFDDVLTLYYSDRNFNFYLPQGEI